ncbi:glucans biosynthesis glucosyltransferase MdoH [Cognatiyoonia sp. IB215182]|uniref:glucans biosynthesis glucosyltransferase MdoH n=1 Tax=Cognatiyoonia sp. IB215182 TaxID=3097353 RepID=UPI002A151BED|nr:glucans biosynthesis glucosyltransferase MdoH [Cognatiyoonia sp. IB215182]MDX8352516.1 glucans biosynthesis glucosyltransferase MdoH [Cognatiyoonia sp. IB215182]
MSVVEHITKAPLDARSLRISPRFAFIGLNFAIALAVFAAFVLSVDHWNAAAVLISLLTLINAIWISGGAATAILGLFVPTKRKIAAPATWQPQGKTAVLITLCGEAPAPVATYLQGFASSLSKADLTRQTEVFVLSDTRGDERIRMEEDALRPLIDAGLVTYRRRQVNTGKKPGNIANWMNAHGERFTYMVVKDADSRMTAGSIKEMIWRMEQKPRLGLLQAGIALIPARTRFGKHQRIASRLLARNFGRGFAAWAGNTANYWGHNAIIRVAAFREAVPLPQLSGTAPLGGAILSHDFVEAAWMRRAGWDIEVAPDIEGSAEDAPQTLGEYFRRDRRWCQGNLQHLRLVGQPGLHWLSRFHFVTGIFSYIAAPIWLLLVALLSTGAVSVSGFAPVLLVASALLAPKICALIDLLPRARTWARRAVILRASLAELVVSALIAPLILLRHAMAVFSILMGRDCGWKSGRQARLHIPSGWVECGVGLLIFTFALTSGIAGAPWLALIYLPLMSAPVLVPSMDRIVS